MKITGRRRVWMKLPTLMDWTKVKSRILMLTLLLSNLMSLAARKSLRNPTLTNWVASMMLPRTVMKSNVFQESLKYGCNEKKLI